MYNKNMKETAAIKYKTVQQVAQEQQEQDKKCTERTVQKWCQANDVPYIGSGRRKQYLIYPEHEKKFIDREKPGRRWTAKKTKKKK